MNDYTTTTDGRTAQVYRDNGHKWQARIEADSTEVLRRLVCAIEANGALVDAIEGLSAALMVLESVDPQLSDSVDDYLSENIIDLRTALAAVKGEQ